MQKELYKVRNFYDFRELLAQSVALYGENSAFKYKNEIGQIQSVSYNKLQLQVYQLGTALLNLGLEKKKIIIAGKNSYNWCLSYLSVVCGSCVAVPTDKELKKDDILNVIKVSGASAIICDNSFAEKLDFDEPVLDNIVLITMDKKRPSEKYLILNELIKKGKMLLSEGFTDYVNYRCEPNKMSVLLFTSGTTGKTKAVMLSASNICSDISAIMKIVKINCGEQILSLLPLHHTYECTVTFLCCLYGGVTICFNDGLRYLKKNMQEYQPDILIMVPLMLEKFYKKIEKALSKEKGLKIKVGIGSTICKAAKFFNVDSSDLFFKEIKNAFGGNVRLIICGAAGIKGEIIREIGKFGIEVFQGYGLTECSPIIMCNSDKNIRADSVGMPVPGAEAKIINPDENGIGEICVKGPMVMLGYYNNFEETEKVFDDEGWFHTGDLGYRDDDGYYYISGRCKNVIVTNNGKNIYPEELEALLLNDACIKECIVSGKINKNGDTVVSAKIFPDRKVISERYSNRIIGDDEIKTEISKAVSKVNESVVEYKKIRDYEIVKTEFEKTTTEKIKR